MRTSFLVAVLAVVVAAPLAAQEIEADSLARTPQTAWTPPLGCFGHFSDVLCGSQFDTFVEQLYRDGITSGCGGGKYCPNSSVTRKQMAVFVERAMHGASGWPPNTVLVFPVKNPDGTPNDAASGTELLTRVASIPASGAPNAPSSSNPWAVVAAAGLYDLGGATLTIPSYVTLQGAGTTATGIKGAGGGTVVAPLVIGSADAAVRDLTILATGAQANVLALVVAGSSFGAESVAVYAMNGTSSNGAVYANGATNLRLVDVEVHAYTTTPTAVEVVGSTKVVIDRARIVIAPTGSSQGRGIELSASEAWIKDTRVRHAADGSCRGTALHLSGGSTCQLDDSWLEGHTTLASSAFGVYMTEESVLRSNGSRIISEKQGGGTGTSYGLYCSSSTVTLHGGQVWGGDYGVYTTGATSTHTCSIQHASLQGLDDVSISNGANYNTLVASCELRGGGALDSGYLMCFGVYDTTGSGYTCP